MNAFANNLAKKLKAAGKSAYELAIEVEVSHQAVYKWLDGGEISPANLRKVAEALSTAPALLLYGYSDYDALEVAEALRLLPPEDQEKVMEYLCFHLANAKHAAAHSRAKSLQERLALMRANREPAPH